MQERIIFIRFSSQCHRQIPCFFYLFQQDFFSNYIALSFTSITSFLLEFEADYWVYRHTRLSISKYQAFKIYSFLSCLKLIYYSDFFIVGKAFLAFLASIVSEISIRYSINLKIVSICRDFYILLDQHFYLFMEESLGRYK